MMRSNRKSLLFSLVLGGVSGLLFVVQFLPMRRFLDYPTAGGLGNGSDFLAMAASFVARFVGPPIASVLAKSRPFLWGFVSPLVFDAWNIAFHSSADALQLLGLPFLLLDTLICVSLTSGPVAIYRRLEPKQNARHEFP